MCKQNRKRDRCSMSVSVLEKNEKKEKKKKNGH